MNQGSQRINELGNVVYLRVSNIIEAAKMHDAIKEDNIRSLQTDYIPLRVWAQVHLICFLIPTEVLANDSLRSCRRCPLTTTRPTKDKLF